MGRNYLLIIIRVVVEDGDRVEYELETSHFCYDFISNIAVTECVEQSVWVMQIITYLRLVEKL